MTSVNSSPISKLSFHDSDEEDFGLTHKNENGVGAHTTNDDPDSEADYNTRMDEIFSDSGDSNVNNDSMNDAVGEEEEEEEEEGFVYTGKDAEPPSGGYREQLRDVLDEEIDSEDDTYGPAIDPDTSAHDLNISRDDYEGVHVVRMHIDFLVLDHSCLKYVLSTFRSKLLHRNFHHQTHLYPCPLLHR